MAPVIQLHPTRRCNLACAHCYTSSSPSAGETLGLDVLTAALEDAAALGYRQLAVSGGEPLVYEQLPALLGKARALGMVTSLTTNGMLATAARWAPLSPLLDVVAVSIDGTPDEHDRIRRRQGAFAATVKNLQVIRESGVPFGFIFTLTQHNVDSLEFVVRLAAEHGARSVQVHPLTLHGRARTDLPFARPDETEIAFALYEAERLGRELGVSVHVDAVTYEQLLAHRDHFVPAGRIARLTAIAPVLVVESDGNVLPLTHEVRPDLRLGSVLRSRLGSLSADWMAAGAADTLAEACAQTWAELTTPEAPPAVYWFDEVAARTRRGIGTLRIVQRECG